MNTIVAESLDYCATKIEEATGGKKDLLNEALQSLLKEIITEHGSVVFNGDNYSEEWHSEAARRGLLNLKTSVDALPVLDEPEVKALFEKYGVLSERELESRYETYLEQYCLTVNVEANLMKEMAKTMIFPAAIRYQGELASTCANLKAIGAEFDTDTLDKVTALVKSLQDSIGGLEKTMAIPDHGGSLDHAKHYLNNVLPAMAEVRTHADELEGIVADDLWPLPTYQEMLFIK